MVQISTRWAGVATTGLVVVVGQARITAPAIVITRAPSAEVPATKA